MWKVDENQLNYLYLHDNPWFKVERFLKYLIVIPSRSWDIAIFVVSNFLILQFLTMFASMELQTFVRNHAFIPKSQTMLLSFLQILKVNFIWRLLVAYLDWMLLNKENGNAESFFSNSQAFVNGLHKIFELLPTTRKNFKNKVNFLKVIIFPKLFLLFKNFSEHISMLFSISWKYYSNLTWFKK